LRRRTALRVDLAAGVSAPDAAPPTPTGALLGTPHSASRALLRWTAASDDVGVVRYLVYDEGVLVGIAEETRHVVAGLAPGALHVFSVEALDADGKRSSAVAVPVTTFAEDRGP
jgi:hypothetical protein